MGGDALSGLCLGLSGPYCAGKNLVASLLTLRGFECLDVDGLGHRALDESRPQLLAAFGPAALGEEGQVDRRALAALVFKDRTALARLESIVHPRANALAEAWLAQRRGANVCVNAALLHRMPSLGGLDAVLYVSAPWLRRLRRAQGRDGLAVKSALRRILSQRGFRHSLRAACARAGVPIFTIGNDGGEADLGPRLDAALARIRAMGRHA